MGADNSGVIYALWNYPAQAADELSFREGDMVTILQRPDGVDWWWPSLCGREGFVPNNYFGNLLEVDGSGSDGNRKTKALSDKQLLQVAESLGQEWEQAAIYLKLSITDLDNIKAERQTSVHAEAEDVELSRIRADFVQKVPMPVIKGLLDDLWQKKVLSTEDKDSVTENQTSKVDRARCLIDM
ncbi:hypothetical protein NHX12_008232, partial [Muraenolepis orangiensis]